MIDVEKLSQLAEDKIADLSELLDISDDIAKGNIAPLKEQIHFLKLSIDTRLKLIERLIPQKQEHSGSVKYEILGGDKESKPIPAPSITEVNTSG